MRWNLGISSKKAEQDQSKTKKDQADTKKNIDNSIKETKGMTTEDKLQKGKTSAVKALTSVKSLRSPKNEERVRGVLLLADSLATFYPPASIVTSTMVEVYNIIYPKVRIRLLLCINSPISFLYTAYSCPNSFNENR